MMLLRCHCCHQEDTFIKRLEASLGKSNSDSGLIYLASKFTHVLHTIVNHFQLNKMGLESRRVHHGKIIPNVIGVPRPLVSSCLALSPARNMVESIIFVHGHILFLLPPRTIGEDAFLCPRNVYTGRTLAMNQLVRDTALYPNGMMN